MPGDGHDEKGWREVQPSQGCYAANSINCLTGAPDFNLANPSLISASLIRPEIK